MTLTDVEQLGLMFRRGGPRWRRYVEPTRELWRATKHGGKASWSLQHAEQLARALGLTKHPIPFGSHCPKCPPPASDNNHPSSTTLLSLPDRYVARCTRCGEQWVRLTERHHLEPFKTR